MDTLLELWHATGIANLHVSQALMMGVGGLLIYLAIRRGFEPLLLVPIGFGAILANIPVADMAGPEGLLGLITKAGISTGVFPLLIFLGIGALTDFGPLIANPFTILLGAAAQFGIFLTLLGALALNAIPGFDFSLADAASIGIIGGADGPTAIFLTTRLAPDLLGAIAVSAYSYMALVPIIQPPVMRALTTKRERAIVMQQLRPVSRLERILFSLAVLIVTVLVLPDAAPLIGMLMFGNLLRESGVVDRLSKTAQNELINIVTAGVLMGKLMCWWSGGKINPLIGAAGVSAVPMSARVVNKVGLETDPDNYLLMHAMGPNVAGVIGSAVAAGVLLALVG